MLIAQCGSTIQEIMATETDEGQQTIDFATGEMLMQGFSLTVTEENANALLDSLKAVLAQTDYAQQIEGIENPFGDLKVTIWFGVEQMGNFCVCVEGDGLTLDLDLYTNEDGSLGVAADGAVALNDEEYTLSAASVTQDQVTNVDLTFTGSDGNESGALGVALDLYAPGSMEESELVSALDMVITLTDEQGQSEDIAVSGYLWPADGVVYDVDEANLTIGINENLVIDLLVQGKHEDGESYAYGQISVGDPQQTASSLYLEYDGACKPNAFGGEDTSGLLRLGALLGNNNYAITTNVDSTQIALEDAGIPSFDGEEINVLSMSEEQMQTLMLEAYSLLMEALGIAAEDVPGLAEMTAGMM